MTSRGARTPRARAAGPRAGAGPEAGRPGNPSRGGGAQVAPPTQGKGQVAVAVSANGRKVSASVGGACPRAQLLQPADQRKLEFALTFRPAQCGVTV